MNAVVGIIGGGQLARMTALAATRLGLKTAIFAPEPLAPAFDAAQVVFRAEYDDAKILQRFAKRCDVVTCEFESIPLATLTSIEQHTPLYPSARAFSYAQNRVAEKSFFAKCDIATSEWRAVSSKQDLDEALDALITPAGTQPRTQPGTALLKSNRGGYDGKGQFLLNETAQETGQAEQAWQSLTGGQNQQNQQSQTQRQAQTGQAKTGQAQAGQAAEEVAEEAVAVLEKFVDLQSEFSIISARSRNGEIAFFPATENFHADGILRESRIPTTIEPELIATAQQWTRSILETLEIIGLLTVEFFVTRDGRLLANEMAPRPHNSGHWTIDAAATSQFEQLLRAILGWPLGSTAACGEARMVNLIGEAWRDYPKYLSMSDANLHLYAKRETRKGRKMGHVTFRSFSS